MTHIIASGRVFLRPFEASDAELYRRWRAEAEPMALAGWHERAPLSLAQVERRIARIADDQGRARTSTPSSSAWPRTSGRSGR
jgi:RimJ/RimL family protein N-acetyltransferase